MNENIKVKIKLSRLLTVDGDIRSVVDNAIKASLSIIETEYVKEAPANDGKFKQGIQVKRKGPLSYIVESTATERGVSYPYFLYVGTGSLKGAADFGYTPGRVRAGDVARGVGGIRPNKAAKRAREKSEYRFMSKLNTLITRSVK